MRKWLGVAVVVGLLGATAGACSAAKTQPFPDVSPFCQAKAKAECQVAALCAVDSTTCTNFRTQQCNAAAAAATQGAVRSYNADNAQACIDAVNGAFGNNNTAVKFSDLYGDGSINDKCE